MIELQVLYRPISPPLPAHITDNRLKIICDKIYQDAFRVFTYNKKIRAILESKVQNKPALQRSICQESNHHAAIYKAFKAQVIQSTDPKLNIDAIIDSLEEKADTDAANIFNKVRFLSKFERTS